MPAARGQFTVRVKEELAALRPRSAAERRALLAGLLRFAATLHIGRAIGPGEPPAAPAAETATGETVAAPGPGGGSG
ncbi:MAG TPA: hypothetical protein VE776_01220, partial [Actinomycetota bacterium]|nr:hypothetical protein [Actinomycetota bacterium]